MQTFGIGRNEKQGQFAILEPGDGDKDVRLARVEHPALAPGEDEVVGFLDGLQAERLRRMPHPLLQRQRKAPFAGDQRRQQRLALAVVAECLDQAAAEHHAGQQRRGAKVAPQLLEDRRVAGKAKGQPADLLGKGDRAPAKLEHAAPGGLVETERDAVVTQAALQSHRRTGGEKVTGTVAQLSLFFVVNQAHGSLLTCYPAGQARAWR